ncbi:Peptidase propeptide and YPEB domain-containing protein [Burkholderiales bacterium 8X]|nr:Peptidase propeptide and YPEB domain-containing protein [Burkholderiales bacterium 8X]
MRSTSFLRHALMVLSAAAAPAFAQIVDHDTVRCEAMPKAEMKPQMELQRKLTDEGWKVRQVKNFNGCYEVYGFDAAGRRVEAFFNPKTFAKIGEVKQD